MPLQFCQPQHHEHPEGVGDHTGIQHGVEGSLRRSRSNGMIFVNELVGENQQREGQHEDPTRARPGVVPAHDEIGRKEAAGEKQQRRKHIPKGVGKVDVPDRLGGSLLRIE